MIPIKQTILKKTFSDKGNCVQACLASLLEIPLDDVPESVCGDDQYNAMDRFLEGHCNCKITWLNYKLHAKGYCIYVGETNRTHIGEDGSEKTCLHAVIGENGKIVFDPHPSDDGLEKIIYTWLITPLDPSKIKGQ